jgi:outer membrane protein
VNGTRIGYRFAARAALALALLAVPAAAGADDAAGIGYVDQAALSALPAFDAAKRQFDGYGANLQQQYRARARNASPQEQQRLVQEFQSRMADEQRRLLGPLFQRAQIAIASVASSKNLSVVLDKQIVILGGTDVTPDVRNLLAGIGAPVPPVNTPPPSTVGYVDQTQIDAVPSIKAATAEYTTFKAGEDQQMSVRFKSAKTQADRDALLKQYQQALQDEQNRVLKPLADKTTAAMADVARKRGLVLVVDRNDVIYGGTDITADVTSALK